MPGAIACRRLGARTRVPVPEFLRSRRNATLPPGARPRRPSSNYRRIDPVPGLAQVNSRTVGLLATSPRRYRPRHLATRSRDSRHPSVGLDAEDGESPFAKDPRRQPVPQPTSRIARGESHEVVDHGSWVAPAVHDRKARRLRRRRSRVVDSCRSRPSIARHRCPRPQIHREKLRSMRFRFSGCGRDAAITDLARAGSSLVQYMHFVAATGSVAARQYGRSWWGGLAVDGLASLFHVGTYGTTMVK